MREICNEKDKIGKELLKLQSCRKIHFFKQNCAPGGFIILVQLQIHFFPLLLTQIESLCVFYRGFRCQCSFQDQIFPIGNQIILTLYGCTPPIGNPVRLYECIFRLPVTSAILAAAGCCPERSKSSIIFFSPLRPPDGYGGGGRDADPDAEDERDRVK